MTLFDRPGESWRQDDVDVTLSYETLSDAEQESIDRLDKQDRALRYEKNAPTLSECLRSQEGRDNKILGYRQPKNALEEQVDWAIPKQLSEMTEQEALTELDLFLARVLKRAIEVEHQTDGSQEGRDEACKIKELVERFREKLAFIGEKELQEACEGIARELVQVAQAGREVYLYGYQKERSPGYMEIRVMSEIECQLAANPNLLKRFHFGGTEDEIASACQRAPSSYHIAALDDFIISGIKMASGFRPAKELIARGEDASRVMRQTGVYVVAAPKFKEWEPELPISGYSDLATDLPHFYAYYRAPRYQTSIHEVSMTGSHSHTDYGFQTTLDAMLKFYRKHDGQTYFPDERKKVAGSSLALPRLYKFYKPYEEVANRDRSMAPPQSQLLSNAHAQRMKILEEERRRLRMLYPV